MSELSRKKNQTVPNCGIHLIAALISIHKHFGVTLILGLHFGGKIFRVIAIDLDRLHSPFAGGAFVSSSQSPP